MTSNVGGAKKLLTTLLGEWDSNGQQAIALEFPPANLFPNRAKGRHWGSLYQLRSVYRENSYLLSLAQLKNWKHLGGTISLDLTFEMPDKRHRDADNCLAAAKGALDGLADALFVNDKLFDPITIRRKAGKKPGRLVIIITQGERQ
jgi:crossover junction endodeoxyribonuclease RusA